MDFIKKLIRINKINNLYSGKTKPIDTSIDEITEIISNIRKTKKVYITSGNVGNVIISAIYSKVNKGDTILIPRQCDKAVYKAIELLELIPKYITPKRDEKYGFTGSVDPEYIRETLGQNPNIKLVYLNNPTKEGILSNIKAIAEICRNKNVPLIVNESLGTHLDMFDYFSGSAINENVDIVIHSINIPFVENSNINIIHSNLKSNAILEDILFSLSSKITSNKIITFLGEAIDLTLTNKPIYKDWQEYIESTLHQLEALKNLKILGSNNDKTEHEQMYALDKSKILICTESDTYNGFKIKKILAKNKVPVLSANERNVCIDFTFNTSKKIQYIILDTLLAIDEKIEKDKFQKNTNEYHLPKLMTRPYKALALEDEDVFTGEAESRISGGYVWVNDFYYPLLVPGETIDDASINQILEYSALGAEISSNDTTLKTFTVIKNH